jgi:DNA polymerase-1
MLLQVHDELIVETPKENAKQLGLDMKRIMESAYVLKVPINAEVEVGENWAEMKAI